MVLILAKPTPKFTVCDVDLTLACTMLTTRIFLHVLLSHDIFDLPVNGANTRHIIMSAYAFAEKPVSNFPGKHGGVILLVLCNRINNMGRGYFGFTATDHTGFVIASLIEPAKKERYRASKQIHSVVYQYRRHYKPVLSVAANPK